MEHDNIIIWIGIFIALLGSWYGFRTFDDCIRNPFSKKSNRFAQKFWLSVIIAASGASIASLTAYPMGSN